MSARKYFSYIRVSTQRQGQSGTSLAEQQGAIERFATNWGFDIVRRFEERETAAKRGRPVFLDMLKQLKRGEADGVIIHKIDRSARNLRDWADLGSLIDEGIEVHFASESLDLNSRGGRLSADIQAVVASDYIRNLRDETLKGMYGRLNQGLYPFRAPIGYVDTGRGRPKEIDPDSGPLVRAAFDLYSTGNWGFHALSDELFRRGLRSKATRAKVTVNGLSTIFHNPFYIGLMKIKKTGEVFPGKHEPLISKRIYDQVQAVLDGKNIKKTTKHFLKYRRLVKCARCGRSLIGELQKGHPYYRCHLAGCLDRCLREDRVSDAFIEFLQHVQVSSKQKGKLQAYLEEITAKTREEMSNQKESLELEFKSQTERQSRLLDIYMDAGIDHDTYLQKKASIAHQIIENREKLADLRETERAGHTEILTILELATDIATAFISADAEAQRTIVEQVTSRIETDGQELTITLSPGFETLSKARTGAKLVGLPEGADAPITIQIRSSDKKRSNPEIPLV